MTDDQPSFVPENPLEEALAAAASDTSARAAFVIALANAELLFPAPGPPPAEDRLISPPPGTKIELPVVQDQGRSIVPAFTSITQLLRFVEEGTGYYLLAVRDLATAWGDDLWLGVNPRGPGVMLGPADVRALGAQAQAAAGGEGGYELGEPDEEPVALLEAVRAYAERSGTITTAYRCAMVGNEEGAQPRIVIGLDLAPGADRETVFAQLTEAMGGMGVTDFALVSVALHGPGTVARYLVQSTEPFYRREA
jgi:hypothetical protein